MLKIGTPGKNRGFLYQTPAGPGFSHLCFGGIEGEEEEKEEEGDDQDKQKDENPPEIATLRLGHNYLPPIWRSTE